jgi:hypothetical protein
MAKAMAAGACRAKSQKRYSCDLRHSRLAARALICQHLICAGTADRAREDQVRTFCLLVFLLALALRILASALDSGAEAAARARAPAPVTSGTSVQH